jgi:adenine phosphoribosyltransferase
MDLKARLRVVPDFPKPGINFFDVAALVRDGPAFAFAIEAMTERIALHRPQALAAVESRGFLFAAPIAARLGLGLVLVRKKGKLPGLVASHTYELEYGTDTLEVQRDAVSTGTRVVLVDDVLATGGTAQAAVTLLRDVGGDVVASAFLIELSFLKGRARVGVPVEGLLSYAS